MSIFTYIKVPKSGLEDEDSDLEDISDDELFFNNNKKKKKTNRKGNVSKASRDSGRDGLNKEKKKEKEKEKKKEKKEEKEEEEEKKKKKKEVEVLVLSDNDDSRPGIVSFNEIIASKTIMGYFVRVHDLRTLGPSQLLNDAVINYSMNLLKEADTAALLISNDSNLRKPSMYLHSYFMERISDLDTYNFFAALNYIHFKNMYDADRIYVR